MAFELRVFFSGLILFHERQDGTQYVLFPEVPSNMEPDINNKHFSCLFFAGHHLNTPGTTVTNLSTHAIPRYQYMILNRDQLDLINLQDAPVQLNRQPLPFKVPRNTSERDNWNWVLPLVDKNLAKAELNAAYDSNTATWPGFIKAGLKLKDGKLSPVSFGDRRKPWVFKHNDTVQAFASTVCFSTEIEDDSVEFSITDTQTNEQQILSLKPNTGQPGGSSVEVWMMNIEQSVQETLTPLDAPVPAPTKIVNKEYNIYNRLIKNPPADDSMFTSTKSTTELPVQIQNINSNYATFIGLFFDFRDGQGGQLQPCSPASSGGG